MNGTVMNGTVTNGIKLNGINGVNGVHHHGTECNGVQGIIKAVKKINVNKKNKWGYSEEDGPDTWCQNYPIANGVRQSPIDIVPRNGAFDSSLKAKPFRISYKTETDVDIANTGASVKVQIKRNSGLSGGPLVGQYRLEQFHLHWGSTNDRGSEHTINGKMYAAELHLVHWNSSRYDSFAEAADKPDGLAVLGYFVKIGQEHKGFKHITDQLRHVTKSGDNIKAPGEFNPSCLVKDDTSRYWTYLGSLTTPPLYESVTWTVFDDVMEISQEQMDALRSIKNSSDCCIVNNYRPPVPCCGRRVRASFPGAAVLS
ncbi:hypothetical protein FSP39_003195 [Pinctada imbricata]|uniref:Carbonic anhydrase n=1 Tax=Pinctada imbricata TaxID=66713 RepID=A0AA88XH18_PINIB|nr:hypothetical protein FSP39_003195 [Pinctada imbricata]